MHNHIKEYSYLLAIAEEGSITKAAKCLYISQPALSSYLKELENKLNVKLYNRVKNTLIFTREGKLYLDYANKIMQLDAELYRTLDKLASGSCGKVRVGITLTRSVFVIPDVLQQIKQELPEVQVVLTEANNQSLLDSIADMSLDLACVSLPNEYDGRFTPIGDEHVVLLAPKSYQLDKYATEVEVDGKPALEVDLHAIPNRDYIVLKSGHRLHRVAISLFENADIEPNIVYETHSLLLGANLVKAELGMTLAYDSIIPYIQNPQIATYYIKHARVNRYVLAYNQNIESPVVRKVHAIITRQLQR